MKHHLLRLLSKQKLPYYAVFLGVIFLLGGLAWDRTRFALDSYEVPLIIVGSLLLLLGWISSILYNRQRISRLDYRLVDIGNSLSEIVEQQQKLSEQVAKLDTTLGRGLHNLSEEQRNEYKTQVFNLMLTIQSLKDSMGRENQLPHED